MKSPTILVSTGLRAMWDVLMMTESGSSSAPGASHETTNSPLVPATTASCVAGRVAAAAIVTFGRDIIVFERVVEVDEVEAGVQLCRLLWSRFVLRNES
jgi:hypothetical protein